MPFKGYFNYITQENKMNKVNVKLYKNEKRYFYSFFFIIP